VYPSVVVIPEAYGTSATAACQIFQEMFDFVGGIE
jgi:hypothetical protein